MSKSRDLVRKGSFLVMISVFIKFIGLIYRIPLTNMLWRYRQRLLRCGLSDL